MILKIFSVVSNVDSFLVSVVIKNATVYTHIYMCFLHTHIQKSMEIAMDFSQRQHAHVVKHSNQDIEHSQYRLGTIFSLFFR